MQTVGRGRPRKSQPLKLVSPTGTSPSLEKATASPVYIAAAGEENAAELTIGRKRSKQPPQIVASDIMPLTAEGEDSDMEGLDDEANRKRSRQGKVKRGPVSFPCSICKLEFIAKQQMLEHRAKHTKLFKCKTCSEGFFTEEKLAKHMEKEPHNYPCDNCGKVLVSKASLQRHRVVHGEKNHMCDVCNRAFKTARDMKNHKLGKRKSIIIFEMLFRNKTSLRR